MENYMQIDEIMVLWEKDTVIDKTELDDESLNIPKLHSKYYNILIKEKLYLRKLEAELKQLRLDKYEFLTQGPNEDTKDKGWRLPPKGMILKSDIPMYMDADQDMVDLTLKIGLQQEKIDFLDSIIKTIINRNFVIKNVLDWQKFTMGS
jgi:Recombination, repair and ssDNA binding protein UvsY